MLSKLTILKGRIIAASRSGETAGIWTWISHKIW